MLHPNWEVHFACNDPANGNPLWRIEQFQLCSRNPFDIALSLENQIVPPATVKFGFHTREPFVRIGRHIFEIHSYKTWVGNWCWDAILVDAATAANILNYIQSLKLRGIQKFSSSGGWSSLDSLYEKGTFTAHALEHARTHRA